LVLIHGDYPGTAVRRSLEWGGAGSIPLSLNDWPAAADQLDEQHDERQHQKNVNVCADRVKADQSHQPQNQKNYENCPKHRSLSSYASVSLASTVK
jgi:hypothetical protein